MSFFIYQVQLISWYITHFFKAGNRKGHGIHSPFVYSLVRDVIYDNSVYSDYSFFIKIRKQLYKSDLTLTVANAGANSRCFRGHERKVRDLARVSSVTPKYGKLLYRLVRYYKPATIVELGTSIGLSTLYLSKGNEKSNVITIEGNSSFCEFTRNICLENGIHNVSVIHGMFDEVLPKISTKIIDPTFVFIDGNHTYDSTLNYFQFFASILHDGIIVLDDIRWSADMQKAWKEITQKFENQATIDLFFMGIVIRKPLITAKNYWIKL